MFKIHPFEDAITTSWSSGKTTELFIYPENSLFSERNFEFRISSATIDVEHSDFTSLPNYNRLIAVLEGKLEIIHEGKYAKLIQQFEKDEFHGSWGTSSIGKVRDFNVIYNDKFDLKFEHKILEVKCSFRKIYDFSFLLILNESVVIEGFKLKKFDLLEINDHTFNLPVGLNCFEIDLSKI